MNAVSNGECTGAGAAGQRRRAGYRCLFEVAGRKAPLFPAVLER